MDEERKVITFHTIPDLLAPDEEKNTPAYGLKFAKAIEYEWFYRPSDATCLFYDKRLKYHNLRLYGRGEQSTAIYKSLLANGEETSYTNYDWRPLQIIPKFLNLIVNQMTERLYLVKAEAIDKYSTDLKNDYRNMLEDFMVAKPLVEDAKASLGVDLTPPNVDEIPETQEELDLHMNLKYKPAIEIAVEEALKYTLDINDYDEIQSKVIADIATIGIGAVKHSTDPTKGIVVRYCDPADMVYSFPKSSNFKEVYYYGEVVRMPISELKRISGDTFTKEQLEQFQRTTTNWNTYHGNHQNYVSKHVLDSLTVDVLHFTFQALNTVTRKKKYYKNGGFGMTEKPSTFDKSEGDSGFDVVKKDIEVWYEGSLVLGTDYIFNYGLCENMVRPEGLLNITTPNYIMYAPDIYQNRTTSLVGRMIPVVDIMQQIHIKIQQLIAKARPNGVYIDVEGLEEIPMGDGSFLTPLEVIKIYDETGNVLGTSLTAEGEYNYGREPIRELKNGVVDGLDRLISAYNHYLNQLRDFTGMPQGVDASSPNPDTPVAVQQQLALNSNTATKHILMSQLNITKKLARGLCLRLKDIFQYSDLKQAYINAVGKYNSEILDSIKKFHLHDLGINIHLKPDAEEKASLSTKINLALTKGLITLDDAVDIESIENTKLANQLLKIRRSKREKMAHQFELEKIDRNAEAQANAAQKVAQVKMQEYEIKTKSEIDVDKAKTENQKELIAFETEKKSELMEQEFDYNMQLGGQQVMSKTILEREKMVNKERLQDKASTQTSEITDQKLFKTPPKKFESSEDGTGGGINIDEVS